MIRTILRSEKNSLTLQLPDSLVGKTIEVLAFEIDQIVPLEATPENSNPDKANAIEKALAKHRVDLSGFKFDRDEANDYD